MTGLQSFPPCSFRKLHIHYAKNFPAYSNFIRSVKTEFATTNQSLSRTYHR